MRHGPRIVAHVVSYPPARRIGAELATHGLMMHLADAGWRAVVIPHSVRGMKPYLLDGVHVVPPDLTNACHPDIVLAHVPFTVQALGHAKRSDAPLVASGHGGPPGWLAAQAAGLKPALLLANSRTMAISLARTGLPVHVLRPPVTWPRRWPSRRLAPRGWHVTLVNASREKGGYILEKLARRHPELPFLVIGGGYGKQVDFTGTPNVTVLPHGTPMADVWRDTRILIMPSDQESWGMVAVEAMQRGIPVIGSTADGLSECVGHGMPRLDRADIGAWSATLVTAYREQSWQELHIAALRRAAELDPAADLVATERALGALIGREAPMGLKRYRNVRTHEVTEVDPDTFIGRRLAGMPLVWQPVIEGTPTPQSGPGPSSAPESERPGPVMSASSAQAAPRPAPELDPALSLPAGTEPAHSAPVEQWVEWAVAAGADRKAAEAAPKATLIALYGS